MRRARPSDIQEGTRRSRHVLTYLLYLSDFWECGHRLFRFTPAPFLLPFSQEMSFILLLFREGALSYSWLKSNTSREPLGHPILPSSCPRQDVRHTSSLFQLFTEDRQLHLAKAVFSPLRERIYNIWTSMEDVFGGELVSVVEFCREFRG